MQRVRLSIYTGLIRLTTHWPTPTTWRSSIPTLSEMDLNLRSTLMKRTNFWCDFGCTFRMLKYPFSKVPGTKPWLSDMTLSKVWRQNRHLKKENPKRKSCRMVVSRWRYASGWNASAYWFWSHITWCTGSKSCRWPHRFILGQYLQWVRIFSWLLGRYNE